MKCSDCGQPHRILWVYTLRIGRSKIEKAFCNLCELEWLRSKRAA